MGFGTLFFGYFLLLDLPYQTLTNAIAAAIMLIALYKLAYLNLSFKRALYACSVFAVFSLFEAIIEVLGSVFFIKIDSTPLNTACYMLRNFLIGALSVFMLRGMSEVSEEVGLKRLSRKCDIYSKITLTAYVLNLCVPPDLVIIFGGSYAVKYTAFVLSVITTLFTLYVLVMNSINIYSCYSKICMPEDNSRSYEPPKKSRFGFVNRFREHEQNKSREYAEYKLEKMKKRADSTRSKKK